MNGIITDSTRSSLANKAVARIRRRLHTDMLLQAKARINHNRHIQRLHTVVKQHMPLRRLLSTVCPGAENLNHQAAAMLGGQLGATNSPVGGRDLILRRRKARLRHSLGHQRLRLSRPIISACETTAGTDHSLCKAVICHRLRDHQNQPRKRRLLVGTHRPRCSHEILGSPLGAATRLLGTMQEGHHRHHRDRHMVHRTQGIWDGIREILETLETRATREISWAGVVCGHRNMTATQIDTAGEKDSKATY